MHIQLKEMKKNVNSPWKDKQLDKINEKEDDEEAYHVGLKILVWFIGIL